MVVYCYLYESQYNVININRNGIEMLLTTLLLTNNRNVQLALLYRSPSVSVQHLINTLVYYVEQY